MKKNMKLFNKIFSMIVLGCCVSSCAQYQTPQREMWPKYLAGVSLSDMTDQAKVAKRPVFLGSGGMLLSQVKFDENLDYGDKALNDNVKAVSYMANIESQLYDSLRKSGISVQRAGTDVVVVLVRTSLIELNAPQLSATGIDTLSKISDILKKYPATFIEVAGYTDSMSDSSAANKLSMDMAQRVAIYLSQDGINPVRMFVVGRGSSRPIAAQDEFGRITNRRVELRISPAR